VTTDEDTGNEAMEPESKGDEPFRHRPNGFAIAAIFALVISVATVALLTTRSHTVRVPDLTGLTVDPGLNVARTILDTHDLVLGDVTGEQCDSRQLLNSVLDQTPTPGTRVPRGTAVAITICDSLSAPPGDENVSGAATLFDLRLDSCLLGVLDRDGSGTERPRRDVAVDGSRRRMSRFMVIVASLSLVLGAASGVAFAHSHTIGGIYEGIHQEQRAGLDYHHAWTEHGHGGSRFVEIFAQNINQTTWCRAGPSSTVHVHCTYYHDNLGRSYHSVSGSRYDGCDVDLHLASALYGDGHGICDHTWQGNQVGWD